MSSSSRRSASIRAAISMKALPRWLTSITEARAPFHSSNSCWARFNTSSGIAAGPALKFHARDMVQGSCKVELPAKIQKQRDQRGKHEGRADQPPDFGMWCVVGFRFHDGRGRYGLFDRFRFALQAGRLDHEAVLAQHDLVIVRQAHALAAPTVDARRGAFGFEDQSVI